MIPYTKPKLSDLYILLQNNLLENRILHIGTYLYTYIAHTWQYPPPPRGLGGVHEHHDGRKEERSLAFSDVFLWKACKVLKFFLVKGFREENSENGYCKKSFI